MMEKGRASIGRGAKIVKETSNFDGMSREDLIGEVKKLTKALQGSNDITFSMLNMSYYGYWDWHLQDDYEYMSHRFWEIFGYDYRTKTHHPSEWQALIHPDDLKPTLENFDIRDGPKK